MSDELVSYKVLHISFAFKSLCCVFSASARCTFAMHFLFDSLVRSIRFGFFARSTIVCFYFLFCLAHDRNRQVNLRCIRIVWYIWGSCLNDMVLSKHDLPENLIFIRRSVVHVKFQMHSTDFFLLIKMRRRENIFSP